MTKSANDMLLEVLQAAGLPIDTHTISNIQKVVEADLALVVASWVDLAHYRTVELQARGQAMDTSRDALQAILRQFQEPIDQAMLTLQGELGAFVSRFEDDGSDEESYALGIYNQAYDLRLQVKAFFETWLDK